MSDSVMRIFVRFNYILKIDKTTKKMHLIFTHFLVISTCFQVALQPMFSQPILVLV